MEACFSMPSFLIVSWLIKMHLLCTVELSLKSLDLARRIEPIIQPHALYIQLRKRNFLKITTDKVSSLK